MVVRSGAKISVLGNDTVLADRDFGDAIKRGVVANPTMITDHHLPGESDTNSRPDQYVVTNFGPKQP